MLQGACDVLKNHVGEIVFAGWTRVLLVENEPLPERLYGILRVGEFAQSLPHIFRRDSRHLVRLKNFFSSLYFEHVHYVDSFYLGGHRLIT
jgi:hypothetical protein